MFKFTIRDLLWLTVVVALGVGWFVDRNGLEKRAAAVRAEPVVHRWREFYETHLADAYPLSAGVVGGRRDVVLATVRKLVAAFDEQRQFVVAHPLTAWDMLAPKRMR